MLNPDFVQVKTKLCKRCVDDNCPVRANILGKIIGGQIIEPKGLILLGCPALKFCDEVEKNARGLIDEAVKLTSGARYIQDAYNDSTILDGDKVMFLAGKQPDPATVAEDPVSESQTEAGLKEAIASNGNVKQKAEFGKNLLNILQATYDDLAGLETSSLRIALDFSNYQPNTQINKLGSILETSETATTLDA